MGRTCSGPIRQRVAVAAAGGAFAAVISRHGVLALLGGERQPSRRRERDVPDRANNGGETSRPQAFFHSPQHIRAARGFDNDEMFGIEPEA